jgi:hypothetical protein
MHTPIYESVARDLRYRPEETRIKLRFLASNERAQALTIKGNGITWYFPNAQLLDFNPA